jgi:spermidine synthase
MKSAEKNAPKHVPEYREYHSTTGGIFFEAKHVLFEGKSNYQKIEVIENIHWGKVLFLDGLVQTTEKDEYFYHEMLVHTAFAAHPAPRSLLIVGGGDGGALKEALKYSLGKAFLVEIDPQVIQVCKEHFPWLSAALRDERATLVIANGTEFLRRTAETFDVVIVDSSDPVGPSAQLHDADFFEDIKKRLRPGGVITAQMGSAFYDRDSLLQKMAALERIFKKSYLYTGPVPSYPGGVWCYAFLSEDVDPLEIKRDPPKGLRYYNIDIHHSAFILPNYLKKAKQNESD